MNLQFTPAHRVVMHFSDLNPNAYDNLNNMKLDLNVSLLTSKVKFSATNQSL